jgi:hypothetical protein
MLKTRRNKSFARRKYTRRNGGACPCAMRTLQTGGRGGMGGAELGHAYTTGASQTLYQLTGKTPGLSSGGAIHNKKMKIGGVSRSEQKRRATARAKRAHNAEIASRLERFEREHVTGNTIPGYEGNEYKHHNKNSRHNKLHNEYLSEWVKMFKNTEGFNANALIK